MGKLAEIKTKENSASVDDFINSIPDEQKRNDPAKGEADWRMAGQKKGRQEE